MVNNFNRQNFLIVLKKFKDNQLTVEVFCAEFTQVWIEFRNSLYKIKETWDEPYDEILLNKFVNGEINDKKYREMSAKLWGGENDQKFSEAVDRIHSACQVYNPRPEYLGDIDEPSLRTEIDKILADYQPENFF